MPGERGPRKVPMMPLADFVALRTSVSNHSSRKSAELIVMSLKSALNRSAPNERKCRPRRSMAMRSLGASDVGSGGTMPRIGRTAWAMKCIRRPYSSYASASRGEWRTSSRRLWSWSDQEAR